jgi:RND family efflux transporter MFP subunit
VRRLLVDMGTPVRAGQLLAEIETPELDQELSQAQANLAQTQATLGLARATVERLRDLVTEGAITRQDFDERQAAFEVARANAAAARANVERLAALKRFGQVVAPFAGVVTGRNVDTGALVAAGGGASGAGARPLFTLAQVDTVRVMASVPQSVAASVRVGQAAGVVVQELGGAPIQGRVTRTAQALDPATRTLLVEVQAPNLDRRLMPGMFARVTLTTEGVAAPLLVPANTLITGTEGPQAALVRDGRVHLVKLVLGRDYGTEVEVLDGLEPGAVLVVNPSDDVVEGHRCGPRRRRPPSRTARRPGAEHVAPASARRVPRARPEPGWPSRASVLSSPAVRRAAPRRSAARQHQEVRVRRRPTRPSSRRAGRGARLDRPHPRRRSVGV